MTDADDLDLDASLSGGKNKILQFLEDNDMSSPMCDVGCNTECSTTDAAVNTGEVWPAAEEVLQKWQDRCYKADELIAQLKLVVRAQHKKIEELHMQVKDTEQVCSQVSYAVDSKPTSEASEARNNATAQALQETVRALRYELGKSKKQNSQLSKICSRYKRLVEEGGGADPESQSGNEQELDQTESVDLSDHQRESEVMEPGGNEARVKFGTAKTRSFRISRQSSNVTAITSRDTKLTSRRVSGKSYDALFKLLSKVPSFCYSIYQLDPDIVLDKLYSAAQTITDNKATVSMYVRDKSLWRSLKRPELQQASKYTFPGKIVLYEYIPSNVQAGATPRKRPPPQFTLDNIRVRKKDLFVQPMERQGCPWVILQVWDTPVTVQLRRSLLPHHAPGFHAQHASSLKSYHRQAS